MESTISKRTFDVNEAIGLAYRGFNNTEIGYALGVDESRIRAAFKDVEFDRSRIPTGLERFTVDLDKPLTIEGDVMVTADWHIPLFDVDYTNVMLDVAAAQGLKTLIVAGDFFNMDSLSRFEDKQENAGLERELNEGIDVMRVVLQNFDRVVYVWGNHDARLHKSLGLKLQFKNAMRLVFDALEGDELGKIEFTNLDHVWVTSNDEDWYICHPASYTRIPLTTARVLATKLNANVITAHSHHCAVGYAIDGERVVAEIGGLFDASKTSYLQRTTTFPTWSQGFAYLEGGKLRVHSPGWSLI